MSDKDIEKATNYKIPAITTNDYLIARAKYPKAVLNLDNYGSGTHWVGIKKIGKNIYDYEDSFGVQPPFNIKKSLIFYNPYVKQKDYETNCGARAINSIL